MEPRISLRISGTKSRQGGFSPLVVAGPSLQSGKTINLDRPAQQKGKINYVIYHCNEYSFYMMVDGAVKSYDSATDGVLTIAITIPGGYRLDNGNAYQLLNEVYQTYVDKYMVPNQEGGHTYTNTDVDTDLFAKIVNQYGLKPVRGARVMMNDAGVIGSIPMSQETMKLFFNDTLYPQFSDYNSIEVGEFVKQTPGLDIEVPRKIEYKVYLDGEQYAIIRDPNESIRLTKPDTASQKYEKISFTLDEVFASPNNHISKGKTEISYNEVDNSIRCKLGFEKIPYFIEFNTTFHNKESQKEFFEAVNGKKLKALCDGEDVSNRILTGHSITTDYENYIRVNNVNVEFSDAETKKRFSIYTQVIEERPKRSKFITTNIKFIPSVPVELKYNDTGKNHYGNNYGNNNGNRNPNNGQSTNYGMNNNVTVVDYQGESGIKDAPQKKIDWKKASILSGIGGFILGAAITFLIMWFVFIHGNNSKVNTPVNEEDTITQNDSFVNDELDQEVDPKSGNGGASFDTDPALEESAAATAETNPAPTEEPKPAVEQAPQITRAQAREEITKLVNEEKDIATCKKSEYWDFLSKSDKHAVELAVTGTDAAIQNKLNSLEGVSKTAFKKSINDAIGKKPYTWDKISKIPSKVNEALSQFE